MRLFVALGIDDDTRVAVDRALGPLRERDDDVRWTRPDGWHVTLAFLGDVDAAPEEVAAAVERGAREAATGPIELRLAEPGRFGRRVLWLGIADEPEGAVARLGEGVQAAIEDADLPVERRDVHPHVTIARPRGRGELPRRLADDVPRIEGRWTARQVLLLRSYTESRGARYETLERVRL